MPNSPIVGPMPRKVRRIVAIFSAFVLLSLFGANASASAAGGRDVTIAVDKALDDGSEGTLSWAADTYSQLTDAAGAVDSVTIELSSEISDFYTDKSFNFVNDNLTPGFDFTLKGTGSGKAIIHTSNTMVLEGESVKNASFLGFTIEFSDKYAREFISGESKAEKIVVSDVHAINAETLLTFSSAAEISDSTFEGGILEASPNFDGVESEERAFELSNSKLLSVQTVIRNNDILPLTATISNSTISGDPIDLEMGDMLMFAEGAVILNVDRSKVSDSALPFLEADGISGLSLTNSQMSNIAPTWGSLIQVKVSALKDSPTDRVRISGNLFSQLTTEEDLIEIKTASGEAPLNSSGVEVSHNTFRDNNLDSSSLFYLKGSMRADAPIEVRYVGNEVIDNRFSGDDYEGVFKTQSDVYDGANISVVVSDSQFLRNDGLNSPILNFDLDVDESTGRTSSLDVEHITTQTNLDEELDTGVGSAIDIASSGRWSSIDISNSTFVELGSAQIPVIGIEGIMSSTVNFNHLTVSGAPIAVSYADDADDTGSFTIHNTVIDSGTNAPYVILEGASQAAIVSSAKNYTTAISPHMDSTVVSPNQLALSKLGDNGSDLRFAQSGDAMWTMLPGEESVLLGQASAGTQGATDQRGIPRDPTASDVGAVERYMGTVEIQATSPVEEGDSAEGKLVWKGFGGKNSLANRVDGPAKFDLETVDGTALAGTDFIAIQKNVVMERPGEYPFSITTLLRDGKQGNRDLTIQATGASGTAKTGVTIVDAADPSVDPSVDPTLKPSPRPTSGKSTGGLASTGANVAGQWTIAVILIGAGCYLATRKTLEATR